MQITDDAVEAAARLSHRYITERRLPDKAIDLIDEAASKHVIDAESQPQDLRDIRRRVEQIGAEVEAAAERNDYETTARLRAELLQIQQTYDDRKREWETEAKLESDVSERDIAELIQKITGIPVARMLEGEGEKLLQMEDRLHERVIGQDAAIAALSDAIRRARAGLKDPRRPIGSFIFLGPTGVGKTELAKALAEFMFDDEDAMIRLDMSEYQERHTVSRLVGAPPGYVGYDEGGGLTEAVRRRPYRVILFDEIEKAHPDVFNALLQLLDDGRLTDGHGRTVDFRNTVIIMTSNLGTGVAKKTALGFPTAATPRADRDKLRSNVERALREAFRPEFLNRIDEVIIFDELGKDELTHIVELMVDDLRERLAERHIDLALTPAAKDALVKEGYDPEYGARPLRRTVQRQVESPVSKRILAGEFEEGDLITVDVAAGDDGGFRFERQPGAVAIPTPEPREPEPARV